MRAPTIMPAPKVEVEMLRFVSASIPLWVRPKRASQGRLSENNPPP